MGVLLHEIRDVVENGEWLFTNDGEEYFLTSDAMGCNKNDGSKPGTCIIIHTGGGKLQGRVSAKVYAVMLAVLNPSAEKRPVHNAAIDVKMAIREKAIFFGLVYQHYFEKAVWAMHGVVANDYLLKLGRAVYKFLDIVSNTNKSYCYIPSDRLRRSMKKGILGIQTEMDKLELAPHYEEAKKKFKNGITFCSECSDTDCVLNRAMCVNIAETANLISEIRSVEEENMVKFTLLDFFEQSELEYFVHTFTQAQGSQNGATKLGWMEQQAEWPRRLIPQMKLDRILRWDIHTAEKYRDDVWNEVYQEWMFSIIADGENRIPENFEQKLKMVTLNIDDTIFEMDAPTLHDVAIDEGEPEIDLPFDDAFFVDPKWEKWAERKIKDEEWRKEAKAAFTKE